MIRNILIGATLVLAAALYGAGQYILALKDEKSALQRKYDTTHQALSESQAALDTMKTIKDREIRLITATLNERESIIRGYEDVKQAARQTAEASETVDCVNTPVDPVLVSWMLESARDNHSEATGKNVSARGASEALHF